MTTVVTILYGIISALLIVVVLIQAGRGGGMGVALGGGATQSVFGGSGGADFMAKLTYGLTAGFMIGALYLAYASAHTGSSRLQDQSEALAAEELLAGEGEEVNYERIGPNPLPLPQPGAAADAPPEPAEPAVVEETPAAEPEPAEPEESPSE
jgi:preprotein translocase subunit SecG